MSVNDRNVYLKIQGGRTLKGTVAVSGAKNSILPLLFTSLLARGEHIFKNAPQLKDVNLALQMLLSIGLNYKRSADQLSVTNTHLMKSVPCPQSVSSFRASVLCLGPLLSCLGKVKIPLPGGCEIGSRPIDIHFKGLRQLGAKISLEKNYIYGFAPKGGLKAAEITLDFPSVGGTENLIMACVLTQGTSYLKNTACEPEIMDLINYLNHLGANIEKLSPREIKITGVSHLKTSPQPYSVIPDRIEAGTLLLAGACTKGEILVQKCCPDHLTVFLEKLKEMGFIVESGSSEILLKSSTDSRNNSNKAERKYKAIHIKTGVYPAFPTDLQSQFMALMTQLKGLSSLEETIFENRFRYVKSLNLLKANIYIKDKNKAFVQGPVKLQGHKMEATDLRAGAGLVLAALTAQGISEVHGFHHIERGYENLFLKLKSLQASVKLCSYTDFV